MKKILMMMLCASVVALVSCNGSDNEPEQQFDPNGEADWEVRFYTTDTVLLYADYSIKDALNTSLDCSGTTVKNLDTLKADADIWQKYSSHGIPFSQARVIVLPVHLKAGDHVFNITYTRNSTPITAQTLSHLIHTGTISTTDSKVLSSYKGMGITYYGDIEDLPTSLPELLELCSGDQLSLTFKVYK